VQTDRQTDKHTRQSDLSCLSVTLVYCGQTDGWIKMPLGREIGLGPGHIVLDWVPALPQKGHRCPIFGPCLYRSINLLVGHDVE